MIKFHFGRCHALTGDRDGQYAVDLIHPYRLIFQEVNDLIEITTIEILEIVDYHK